jgi:hypothetical protein
MRGSCRSISRQIPGRKAETSSKTDRLVAALEEAAADGHTALVFSQWTCLQLKTPVPVSVAKVAAALGTLR